MRMAIGRSMQVLEPIAFTNNRPDDTPKAVRAPLQVGSILLSQCMIYPGFHFLELAAHCFSAGLSVAFISHT